MPAYHSKLNDVDVQEACSCSMLPLKTDVRGPAPPASPDEEDVIDEALTYFRANVLFRNFEVKGGADRTMIYITLFIHQCLKALERVQDKTRAERDLHQLAIKQFVIPGDGGWPLGSLFAPPAAREEADAFRHYFKQVREETVPRLIARVFLEDGSKSKWWQAFSKRKFMGKEFR